MRGSPAAAVSRIVPAAVRSPVDSVNSVACCRTSRMDAQVSRPQGEVGLAGGDGGGENAPRITAVRIAVRGAVPGAVPGAVRVQERGPARVRLLPRPDQAADRRDRQVRYLVALDDAFAAPADEDQRGVTEARVGAPGVQEGADAGDGRCRVLAGGRQVDAYVRRHGDARVQGVGERGEVGVAATGREGRETDDRPVAVPSSFTASADSISCHSTPNRASGSGSRDT